MNLEEISVGETRYRDGKIDALNTLRAVLDSMKSDETSTTAIIINRILEEIYQKMEQELI